ncbi:class I SAM-dependent methyltransferase [Massilia sp. NR 4-1]|uniref:class I SAM-dependent methyltransferase n=1 Tax=Massilia sp. NR 4-1 TaxID=1678028 RepID=UPI00067B9A90|nr:class I SAM-dependent methyltransferase [Massilia sp. NR 4-1]AKU21094.1 hypothetical protein ACZ75_05930 [Massilia sp. NR 4-1]
MLPFPSLLFGATLFCLCAYILHKVRCMHLLLHDMRAQSQRDNGGLFRQIEALQGLYIDLGLQKSLPGTRGWAASPDFLLELARHALTEKPMVVVECSCGTSTLVLARCMQLNGAGMVYSLEHDPHYARQTRNQLQRHGLSAWAQVIDAPLYKHELANGAWSWYRPESLPAVAGIDMLVIDGPPMATCALARYPAGPLLFPRLSNGAAVFLDDARRSDEQAILRRWAEEFPEIEQHSLNCEKGAALLKYRPRA